MYPHYKPAELAAAFHLRYSWTAWPAAAHQFPTHLDRLLEQLAPAWETDGLRLLEYRCQPDQVQVLASVSPAATPVFCAQRMKGRLDHVLRQTGTSVSFSRKLSVTTVGRNCREQIERYIEEQVAHHRFVDPSWRARLSELTVVDPTVDLAQPTETTRGRYWFNLHVVLVTDWRVPIGSFATLLGLRDRSLRISQEQGYLVSRLTLVPDHLHIALRGPPDANPEEIALTYLNQLALTHGPLWKPGYYVGTFGEYGMAAIRRMSDRAT